MIGINALKLIPQDFKKKLLDTIIDFVSGQAQKHLGDQVAKKIGKLRSDAIFKKNFEAGLQQAVQRFVSEYEHKDEDLVAAIMGEPSIFDDDAVQKSLMAMIKTPGADLSTERQSLQQSFVSVLPFRKNRERVDNAVTYFLNCLVNELWHSPELRPIYSIQFQRLTAETAQQQLDLQKKQLNALEGLNTKVRSALLALVDSLAEQKLVELERAETTPGDSRIHQNLPQPDYIKFLGREAELLKINNTLRRYPASQSHLVTIDGVGGIGKSALALEIAWRHLNDYDWLPTAERFDAFIWVSAKQAVLTGNGLEHRPSAFSTLDDLFKTIAIVLDREDITRARVKDQIVVVHQALRRQRTLLIVDNLETVHDQEAVVSFLQDVPAPTKVIITTRHRIDRGLPVRLTGMPFEEAAMLIQQECVKKEIELGSEETRQLFERTGGVPQAIVWSIAKIGLGQSAEATLASLGVATGDIALYCFRQTFEDIRLKPSFKILVALAVLSDTTTGEILGEIAGFGKDIVSREESLIELQRVSFATKHDQRWGLLPLVKQYVLEMSDPEIHRKYLLRAAKCYCRFVTETVGDERVRIAHRHAYDDLEAERLNIFGVIDWCRENGHWEFVVKLVHGIGYFPHARGYWQDAKKYWELGATAASMVDDQLARARCITYLGYMLFFEGNFAEARECVKNALAEVDEDKSVYQLASILRLQGNLAAACDNTDDANNLLEQSLTLMRRDKNVYGVAKVLNDLGDIAIRTHNYTKAEKLLRESLSLSEANKDRIESTRSYRHLGDLLFSKRQYPEARDYYQKSLHAAEDAGWRDEVANAKYGQAILEETCGDHRLALKLAGEALEIFEQIGQKQKCEEIQKLISTLKAEVAG